jgi:hypothetical protein
VLHPPRLPLARDVVVDLFFLQPLSDIVLIADAVKVEVAFVTLMLEMELPLNLQLPTEIITPTQ